MNRVARTSDRMLHNADIGVREMRKDVQEKWSSRRDELQELLDVDLNWRMHALSDGQRRRVQIMLQVSSETTQRAYNLLIFHTLTHHLYKYII